MKGYPSVCSYNDDTSGVVLNVILNIAFYVVDILRRTSIVPGTSLVFHAFVNFTVQQQETPENTLLGLQAWSLLKLLHEARLSQRSF